MATTKERQIENKNLQAKLKALAPNSSEYNRIQTRINYNNSLIGKTGNVNTSTKVANNNISKTNTSNVQKMDIPEASTNIAKTSLGIAGDLINNNAEELRAGFNPTLTARPTSGNLIQDRQRIEDEVFNRLTRGVADSKNREREQLGQTLFNRGIPLGSDLYNQQMQEFDKKYDTANLDARATATQLGGQEFERSFGIGEQTRANELAEQGGIYNQRIGDINNWNAQGVGNYATVQGVRQNQQQINNSNKRTGIGGGSRGTAQPAAAPSPFNNTPLPF